MAEATRLPLEGEPDGAWLSKGVGGIGTASLLADVGHEVPTALLPSLLTSTLSAPASALGLIEGVSDGLAGLARLAGGALADDPGRRRPAAVGGYAATAVLAAATGAVAIALYIAYNAAATAVSVPAGRASDRLGPRGPARVLAAGVVGFGLAYVAFAVARPSVAWFAAGFVVAGMAIGFVETAEHAAVAALAPGELRGSAFGLLAFVQSGGNLAASAIAGLLWTLVSPVVAFAYLAGWMVVALIGLVLTGLNGSLRARAPDS